MKFKFVAVLALFVTAIAFTACEKVENCHYDESAKTLKCQGQTYSTVETGGRVWMAENANLLNFDSSYCYGNNASFWTADAFDESRAVMVRVQDKVTYEHYNKTIAASVRCVKVK